ncbi:hypothetical protein J4441_03235 [Candidatus Micrarchaeota archaeon]|nr:hypothetical protein [Candidatus Micrarchaeota archaeon]
METQMHLLFEKKWQGLCRLIFKEEIGPLSLYAKWLCELNEPIVRRKSCISGKEVAYAIGEYAQDAKWISLDEVDFSKKWEALSINSIKDIESLVEALSERFYYAGNVVLGNCDNVQNSSNISDSYNIYDCSAFGNSKNLCHCTYGRLSEDSMGCNGLGESMHCLHCYDAFRNKRCFELWLTQNCSDCRYSHNLGNCIECMFCFHVQNKKHAIGNLELPLSKYLSIKEGLLAQMAEKLRRDKRLPNLAEMVGNVPDGRVNAAFAAGKMPANKKPIEGAFEKTGTIVLGKALAGGVDAYEGWLEKRTRELEHCKSALSGESIVRKKHLIYSAPPANRLITRNEAQEIGEKEKISQMELESLDFGNAAQKTAKMAYFCLEYCHGTNTNIIESPLCEQVSNSYRTLPVTMVKYCAYSFWPRNSEYVFGCNTLFDSAFCINCYYSIGLSRCLEMDSCKNCADSYFCHNCENLSDCMFCFNAKNLKYAVGNAEVGKENYMKIKSIVRGEILERLEKGKTLPFDVYSIGGRNWHSA